MAVWRYEFRYERLITLKFTSVPQSQSEFNFLLLKDIISIKYFENYSQTEVKQ